jgi:RNA polymerase sigma factor (sigma-70 family)
MLPSDTALCRFDDEAAPTGAEGAKVLPFRPPASALPGDETTDAELVERCRQRDPGAWDVLVARYERLVFSVARRNGLTTDDAADVTQTAFLSLLDSLDRLKDDTRVASWLMTVARRQAWRLRSSVRRYTDLEAAPEESEDPFTDWAEVMALQDGLAALGDPCRGLLEALYLEEGSPGYAEVAERLGRSIGGIGPLRGRCLDKLRAILTEDGSW